MMVIMIMIIIMILITIIFIIITDDDVEQHNELQFLTGVSVLTQDVAPGEDLCLYYQDVRMPTLARQAPGLWKRRKMWKNCVGKPPVFLGYDVEVEDSQGIVHVFVGLL